ncbi:MAG: ABC transporter permease, partial [Microcystis panniformis]
MKSQSLTSPPRALLPLWGIGFGLLLWWLFTSPLWHSNPILNDFSPERSFVALL